MCDNYPSQPINRQQDKHIYLSLLGSGSSVELAWSKAFMASLLVFFLPLALALVFSFTPSPVLGNGELTALLAIKSSLDPDGHFLASWSANGDHCGGSFEGVACNRHGMVANISLQGKGLTGRLSPAVSQLSSLSGLYLHYNSISGGIPKEISELTELSDLYLNVNNLSGGIPVEIGSMVSLQGSWECKNRVFSHEHCCLDL